MPIVERKTKIKIRKMKRVKHLRLKEEKERIKGTDQERRRKGRTKRIFSKE